MTGARKLKPFNVEENGDRFLFRIEDEAGVVFNVTATHEQVDLIADSLDELLSPDEWDDGEDGLDEHEADED